MPSEEWATNLNCNISVIFANSLDISTKMVLFLQSSKNQTIFMKKIKQFLLIFTTTLCVQAYTQCDKNDSTIMGPQYGNDVYYSFENKTVKSEPANNWHIAFSAMKALPPSKVLQGATIRINGGWNVKLKRLNGANPANWRNIDTTGFFALPELRDQDSNWINGAFVDGYQGAFNFVWGNYSTSTHHIDGTGVYVIYNAVAGWYKKLYINQLTYDSLWNFTISNLDNTDSNFIMINKNDFKNKMFAYYDAITNQVRDREPDNNTWDLLWTKYITYGTITGVTDYHTVTGILQNKGVVASKNIDKSCTDVWLSGNNAPFITNIGNIGWDWKTAPPPVWVIKNNTYLVKSKNGKTYKLAFKGFSGSSQGKTTMITYEATLSVDELNNINTINIFPNPVQQGGTLNFNETIDSYSINDISGKLVLKSDVSHNSIELSNINSGIYIFTVEVNGSHHQFKLIIE